MILFNWLLQPPLFYQLSFKLIKKFKNIWATFWFQESLRQKGPPYCILEKFVWADFLSPGRRCFVSLSFCCLNLAQEKVQEAAGCQLVAHWEISGGFWNLAEGFLNFGEGICVGGFCPFWFRKKTQWFWVFASGNNNLYREFTEKLRFNWQGHKIGWWDFTLGEMACWTL